MMFDLFLSVISLTLAIVVVTAVLRYEKQMNKRIEKLEKGWERLQQEPGPFPGKFVPLEQIEKDIEAAKKEDFKPNAWHKPLPDE